MFRLEQAGSRSPAAVAAAAADEGGGAGGSVSLSPITGRGGIMRDADETLSEDVPWYRNPSQIAAMLSNFSTSYNVVNVSLVLPILEQLAGDETSEDASIVASSLLAGMMLGQMGGGALGDSSALGRLGALRLVMLLQIVASAGSALLTGGKEIYWQLAAWRFVLGIGAGGVYPLAAVLSAEQGQNKHNDAGSLHRVVLTFATQGLGFVAVPLTAVPLLYTIDNLNVIWRILLGLGSLPGVVLMLLQWRTYRTQLTGGSPQVVPQSESVMGQQQENENRQACPSYDRGERQREGREEGSDEENDSMLDSATDCNVIDEVFNAETTDGIFREETATVGWWDAVSHEENLVRKLLGTAATWFLFDVLFYGNTLFEPIVIEAAFGAHEHSNPMHLLQRTAVDSLLLTSIALPGYFVAGLVMGKTVCGIPQTARFVMLQGFACMALLYFIIGIGWVDLRRYPALLVILYGLTFFFANHGPNTTTFVLPSLVYSENCRTTFNGLSAAAGKLGALVGASLFDPAAERLGDASVMLICSSISVFALIMTKLFVPTTDVQRDREEEEQVTV
jgi:PHS family inorganic phosphate transporter-like MFS transporter